MTEDELRSDEEHGVELRYLDSRLPQIGLAAVAARRVVILEPLSDAALPRRLAALDRYLVLERDALAAEREAFAALPRPAATAQPERIALREVMHDRLNRIGFGTRHRAEVVRRLKVGAERSEEATAGLYFGSWRGFSPLA